MLYIQVWTNQKDITPTPAALKITTKEYFDREKQQGGLISGKAITDVIY